MHFIFITNVIGLLTPEESENIKMLIWHSPGINHVSPVLRCSSWQLFKSFDQQYTGITNVATPGFWQLKTTWKEFFIFSACCESWAAWLCLTNTASVCWSVHQSFMQWWHYVLSSSEISELHQFVFLFQGSEYFLQNKYFSLKWLDHKWLGVSWVSCDLC